MSMSDLCYLVRVNLGKLQGIKRLNHWQNQKDVILWNRKIKHRTFRSLFRQQYKAGLSMIRYSMKMDVER